MTARAPNSKIAFVLGGTAGVGHAVTRELLDAGYSVGVVARGGDRLSAMQTEFGDSIATESADVSDAAGLEAAVARLVKRLGTPTVWVNSAMATVFATFREASAEEFERITDVTYHGQVNGTRAALNVMERGNIICVGSGLSYRSVPGQAAYCGAKHAINGFVSAVRSELLRDKSAIHIGLVQLPAINTPQFDWARSRLSQKPQPAPPIFSPEVAARAVMQAIKTDAREVIVGRSVVQLIFGNMFLANWLDKKMADAGIEQQRSDRPPSDELDNLFDPARYPPQAEGSYGDRAETSGLIIDGDRARYMALAMGFAVPFVLGLLLG